MTVWAQDPETKAAKWNSVIIHFIIYSCVKMSSVKKDLHSMELWFSVMAEKAQCTDI